MKKIELSHGAGGKKMQDLIKKITSKLDLKKVKGGRGLDELEDSSLFDNLAFTTDSHTISPLFFPGGDIGKLSVYGTVNDLAVMGADPIALSLSYVIEEGFSIKKLLKITESVNEASKKVGIPIVTGDLKVVEKGELDKLIVNTTGIGKVKEPIKNDGAEVGDKILVSGPIGDHGAALMAKRFDYETDLKSDCGSILPTIKKAIGAGEVHAAKDPTRGGLSACLNELASKNELGFYIDKNKIPVRRETESISESIGISPLQTACEGRMVLLVRNSDVNEILKAIKEVNNRVSIIGEVKEGPKGKVIMKTEIGAEKVLKNPIGEQFPRIC